jgi:CRISPR-associated protein (TIGR03984 family)
VTILYGRAADGISLADAIRAAVPGHAVALLASPVRYQVADVRDSACYGPAGLCSLDDVFEARAFNPDAELRWLHSEGGRGRAVVLADQESALPTGFGQPVSPLAAVEVLPQRYMLWGRPIAPAHDGWTRLHTARIGTLDIPLAVSESCRRVCLKAHEYVSVEPVHGNAYVAEERLLAFEEDPDE